MEIRDVVHSLREGLLQQQLELKSLQSQVAMLERFTWNMLQTVTRQDGVDLVWDLETNVVSTVDSPEGTDNADPTLF